MFITGANGFVGTALCSMLLGKGHEVLAGSRKQSAKSGIKSWCYGDLVHPIDWTKMLEDIDAIVHLAAVTHDSAACASSMDYRKINVDATFNLGLQAATCGVRRFIFLSSVKACREETRTTDGLMESINGSSANIPSTAYGMSKLAAEQKLREIDGLDLVILRPSLIYGLGQRGNMDRLFRFVKAGVPFPLAKVKNKRSLIGLTNVCGAICAALDLPKGNGMTLALSDCALSTPELIQTIADSVGVRPRIWPIPPLCLKAISFVPGAGPVIRRLTTSLVVDPVHARKLLEWEPEIPMQEEMALAARGTGKLFSPL